MSVRLEVGITNVEPLTGFRVLATDWHCEGYHELWTGSYDTARYLASLLDCNGVSVQIDRHERERMKELVYVFEGAIRVVPKVKYRVKVTVKGTEKVVLAWTDTLDEAVSLAKLIRPSVDEIVISALSKPGK